VSPFFSSWDGLSRRFHPSSEVAVLPSAAPSSSIKGRLSRESLNHPVALLLFNLAFLVIVIATS
jgi:hypothetical protein